jgi:two-component system sensor histidine kinase TctE
VLTGYEALSVLPPSADGIALADGAFGEVPIRVATLFREVPTGEEPLEFSVTVAESTRARLELARAILARSAIRLALMIGGAALIVWLTVTLAMQPLRRLGAAISERSPDDLRPIREATPAEVEGIVMAVNSFMGRLDTALAALRNFTGNAGHQLRTPLSVVRMQLALARRAEDAEGAREATEKADTALAQAERVLAQLLLLARVDGAAGQMQARPVDLARLARDVTGEMVPLAARAGVDLGWSGAAEAVVLGEPVLLSEMLRNLIDNALSYGGRGATVTVRVVPGDGVTLEVEDNGPGVSPERLAALAQRRRPADQAAQVGGHGLGLPIVGEIAEIFGARLRLSTGAEGRGFRAAISFPAPGAG